MRHNNRMRKLTIEVDADKASPVIFSLFESSVIPIQQIMEGTTQPLLFGLESWSEGIVQMLKPNEQRTYYHHFCNAADIIWIFPRGPWLTRVECVSWASAGSSLVLLLRQGLD